MNKKSAVELLKQSEAIASSLAAFLSEEGNLNGSMECLELKEDIAAFLSTIDQEVDTEGDSGGQNRIEELEAAIKRAVNMGDMAGHMLSIDPRRQCFNIANELRHLIPTEDTDEKIGGECKDSCFSLRHMINVSDIRRIEANKYRDFIKFVLRETADKYCVVEFLHEKAAEVLKEDTGGEKPESCDKCKFYFDCRKSSIANAYGGLECNQKWHGTGHLPPKEVVDSGGTCSQCEYWSGTEGLETAWCMHHDLPAVNFGGCISFKPRLAPPSPPKEPEGKGGIDPPGHWGELDGGYKQFCGEVPTPPEQDNVDVIRRLQTEIEIMHTVLDAHRITHEYPPDIKTATKFIGEGMDFWFKAKAAYKRTEQNDEAMEALGKRISEAKERPDVITLKKLLDKNKDWHVTFRAGVIKGWKERGKWQASKGEG